MSSLWTDHDAGVPCVGDAPYLRFLVPTIFMCVADFEVMAGIAIPIVEFATAVKPPLLASLVDATDGP